MRPVPQISRKCGERPDRCQEEEEKNTRNCSDRPARVRPLIGTPKQAQLKTDNEKTLAWAYWSNHGIGVCPPAFCNCMRILFASIYWYVFPKRCPAAKEEDCDLRSYGDGFSADRDKFDQVKQRYPEFFRYAD
jgi:hypothetical protein